MVVGVAYLPKVGNADPCFHQIVPLGRFGLVVAMSVPDWVSLSPSHAILPEEQRRSQGNKAVSQRGITTLKKCTPELWIVHAWQVFDWWTGAFVNQLGEP